MARGVDAKSAYDAFTSRQLEQILSLNRNSSMTEESTETYKEWLNKLNVDNAIRVTDLCRSHNIPVPLAEAMHIKMLC